MNSQVPVFQRVRSGERLRSIFLAPAAGLLIFTLLIPLGIMAAYSFLTRGAYGGVEQPWTGENYVRLFDPLYGLILARSLWVSGVATILCLVLAYPMALFIVGAQRKNLYLNLVMLPFWTSFLIRLYAWTFLLRDTGLINTVLQSLGWIHKPLPMLYNDGAVILGLVYGYLPFAVLPIYTALEALDSSLLDAAADLGATPLIALWRVTLPLSIRGVAAAAMLVFVPCLGTYLVSDLLGGGRTMLIGNLIQNQFTTARDWPFGAALSTILIGAAVALLWLRSRSRRAEGAQPGVSVWV
jgi:spermidine/putrescine transport system permease protein